MKSEDQKSIDITKTTAIRSDGEDYDQPEEGEIIGGGDGDTLSSSSSSRPGTAVVQHPLEHSWTFWFDNPSAKSKQAAWGSSMRPVYTFSTVEEFWRYIFCLMFDSLMFFDMIYYVICVIVLIICVIGTGIEAL